MTAPPLAERLGELIMVGLITGNGTYITSLKIYRALLKGFIGSKDEAKRVYISSTEYTEDRGLFRYEMEAWYLGVAG